MEMIHATDLSKNYDGVQALEGVSFSVLPGEIIGLLGPNGAGKTTLMKILTGYLHPSRGQALIDGIDVVEEPARVQAQVGYLPENAPLYPELSVQAHLKMVADLRAIPEAEQPRLLSEAIRAVGLEERLTRPVATLSKGYRQRVGLAQALVHQPRLLVLDEPTNGLDPTQISQVRALIKRLAARATVMVSTHILSEVEATCDRVLIIMDGRLRADARLDELSRSATAFLTVDGEVAAEDKLRSLEGAIRVRREPRGGSTRFVVETTGETDICPAIYRLAVAENWPVRELKQESRTLEAVFNELAGRGGAQ